MIYLNYPNNLKMTLKSNKVWKVGADLDATNHEKIITALLESRGIKGKKAVNNFLDPSLDQVPDASLLFGCEQAAQQILEAIKSSKSVCIHGDFDCDGVCATAILWDFLYRELADFLKVKINVTPYIPSRVDEGYGLSESSIQAMKSQGAQLVITVDCGIRDRKLIEKHTSKDFTVIVTDHHEPPDDVTKFESVVVHPMYPGSEYLYPKICGSAVAFLLTQSIRKAAGMEYELKESVKGLDLVGLATVTDMMPLVEVNRVFVVWGLKQMKQDTRLGLDALLRLATVDKTKLDSYHFGFVIGSKINAAGRIGHAMDALRLLLAPNPKSAMEYSSNLHNLNLKRQVSTEEILKEVEGQLKEFEDKKLVFLTGKNWHEGVIGLVAGRIFERTGKPTIVVTLSGKEVKASARSGSQLNITQLLKKHSKYLEKYGGHAQAAGMSIKPELLEEFKTKLTKYCELKLSKDDLKSELEIDLRIEPQDITQELFSTLEKLKPYGFGNAKPTILIEDLSIIAKQILSGGKHMKLSVEKEGNQTNLLMFNCDEDIPLLSNNDRISVVGNISSSEWNGKMNLEFQVREYKLGGMQ